MNFIYKLIRDHQLSIISDFIQRHPDYGYKISEDNEYISTSFYPKDKISVNKFYWQLVIPFYG